MPFMLYLLACAVCAMGTSEFMLAGLLPAIASDLGVTMGAAGVLTSGFAVGMAVGAPLMAGWTRRWAPRLTLLWCLLVFACCHVLAAITTDYSILLTTRVVSALANAGFLAVALGLATQLVPADRKGRALSILLSGTTIAMVAGVPAGALIGTALGWRATFWCVAGLCLLVTAGLARGWSEHAAVAASSTSTTTSLGAELRQLRSPGLLGPMLLGALVNGATFAALTYLAPIVTEISGLAEGFVAVVLMLFGAGSFVGVAIAGRLADQRPGLLLGVGGPLLLGGLDRARAGGGVARVPPDIRLRARGAGIRGRERGDHQGPLRRVRSAHDGWFVRHCGAEHRRGGWSCMRSTRSRRGRCPGRGLGGCRGDRRCRPGRGAVLADPHVTESRTCPPPAGRARPAPTHPRVSANRRGGTATHPTRSSDRWASPSV